jgi:hypothetical protein
VDSSLRVEVAVVDRPLPWLRALGQLLVDILTTTLGDLGGPYETRLIRGAEILWSVSFGSDFEAATRYAQDLRARMEADQQQLLRDLGLLSEPEAGLA